MRDSQLSVNRRKALAILGSGAVSGLAGCNAVNMGSNSSQGNETEVSQSVDEETELVTERPAETEVNFEGAGTAEDPYLVSTVGQLQYVAVPGPNSVYKQTANIDARGTDKWSQQGFRPIAGENGTDEFGGTYDGNGNQIRGLSIEGGPNPVGLFNSLSSEAVVKNLGLVDVDISGPSGGAVTRSVAGEIRNVSVTGRVFGGDTVGGVVGEMSRSAKLDTVSSNVTVAGTGVFVGALTGRMGRQTEIVNSSSSGRVVAVGSVGGLVGEMAGNSRVATSMSTARVTAQSDNVGGIVGRMRDRSATTDSFSDATVTGTGNVGGIVGNFITGSVSNVGTTASVSGTRSVGGIAGTAGRAIVNSYSRASVVAEEFGGGVVGSLIGDLSRLYVVPTVSLPSGREIGQGISLGAIAGQMGSDATIGLVYWTSGADGISQPVSPSHSREEAVGDTELSPDQMTGESVTEIMIDLDYSDTWQTSSESFPQLQALNSVRDRDSETAPESEEE